MGKKHEVECVNFINLQEYVPFIHNLQESVNLAQDFENKLRTTDDGIAELKKYCGIDDSFRISIDKEKIDYVVQMFGTNIIVQCWMTINIFDSENKFISKGETFYFDVHNGKVEVMDFMTEEYQT